MIDVLVVGAGPTGLMMAAELARHGLTCRIIDKSLSPSRTSKALGIQARTLEIFEHLGISTSFLDQGFKIRGINAFSSGRLLGTIHLDQMDTAFPFILSLEQSKTEDILSKHVSSLGIRIERGIEWISMTKQSDVVQSIVRSDRGEDTILSHWVIACDGGHSSIRETLSLPFEGKSFEELFLLADVQLDWDYPLNESAVFLESHGVLVALPFRTSGHYRLIVQSPSLQSKDSPSLEQLQKILNSYAKGTPKVDKVIWTSHFHIHSKIVSSYRSGKIFVAGDAAHVHSPIGGQGMNTGLQDAFNLAWKLALVHKKKVHPDLLDTYGKERASFGKNLLRNTERASRLILLKTHLAITIRNLIFSLVIRFPLIQRAWVKTVSQLGIQYPKNCAVIDGSCRGLKAGTRAPNAIVFQGNIKTDFYSIWRKTTGHHLILFTDGNISSIHSLILEAERFSSVSIMIVHTEPNADERIYSDLDRIAHRVYKVQTPVAYLIRPDIYIGARDQPPHWEAIQSYLKLFQ